MKILIIIILITSMILMAGFMGNKGKAIIEGYINSMEVNTEGVSYEKVKENDKN